jgi:hypothetical protein
MAATADRGRAARPSKTEAHRQAARLGWQTRRRRVADQLGGLAVQLLEAIGRDLAERKRLNLRDAGILLGIVLDKAEAITAAAGPGPLEPRSDEEVREHLTGLISLWQERAKAGGDG